MFFRDFPTLDDARGDLARVRTLLEEEKAALLEEVGQWGESLYLEVLRIEVRLTIHVTPHLLGGDQRARAEDGRVQPDRS